MYLLEQVKAASGGGMGFWIPLIIVYIIIFYFLFVRPKKLQDKKRLEMLNNLQTGREVITNGGLCGKIVKIEDKFFYIKIAQQVEVKVLKEAVNPVLEEKQG